MEKKCVLYVELSEDLARALESYRMEQGYSKKIAVDRLLRKALGVRVQQMKLF